MFEDSMNLIAKLPTIAAAIYRWGAACALLHAAACGGGNPAWLGMRQLTTCLWIGLAACRNTYKGGDLIEAHPSLDWGANLAHMMGACRSADMLAWGGILGLQHVLAVGCHARLTPLRLPALFCPALPCSALPCSALPCSALPVYPVQGIRMRVPWR